MAKDLNMTLLFDFYHNMLTDKQADVIDLYYNHDLSLAEISEHLLITRQGVRDAIKRAEMIMKDAEDNLGIAKRYITIRNAAEKIQKEIDEIELSEQVSSLPWLSSRLKRIRNHLNDIKE